MYASFFQFPLLYEVPPNRLVQQFPRLDEPLRRQDMEVNVVLVEKRHVDGAPSLAVLDNNSCILTVLLELTLQPSVLPAFLLRRLRRLAGIPLSRGLDLLLSRALVGRSRLHAVTGLIDNLRYLDVLLCCFLVNRSLWCLDLWCC